MPKKAIIIGAGPAGLTAAYELLTRTDIKPVILEKCDQVGGISKTINYKGNRMDFGPHRFFSKSDRVMNWWLSMMPCQSAEEDITIHYQNKSRTVNATAQDNNNGTDKPSSKSLLIVKRLTRIYFLRKFFNYPIQLSVATLRQLGLATTIKIICSYLWTRLFPRKPENSLEDFIVNKFGTVLYKLFFKDYTEKVWGIPCEQISADWGAQRIKGVSLSKAIIHAARSLTKKTSGNLKQKNTETSLIEQFLYPAKGAGQMWEIVADKVEAMGGKIVTGYEVKNILTDGNQVVGIEAWNDKLAMTETLEADYFISTMPVQELIAGMNGTVPKKIRELAVGLQYRDFINVGVLVRKMAVENLRDNWIYIQERDVKVARMQIYNNWGPYMVNDPETVWLGLEYFCTKGDGLWSMTDHAIKALAVMELENMALISKEAVLDTTVQRMEKTYPAYFGTYNQFDQIRAFTDRFENLFLVGRNGMHKYNNSDHSMLTAMVAVDNICAGITSKENIWAINTEQEYHEEKQTAPSEKRVAPEMQPVPVGVPEAEPSFIDFIWRNQWNRRYVFFALAAFLVQFIIFKFYYPYANYMPDSYSYLEAAAVNADVNMWPVAYSKFLRLFSVFTHSDKILTGFQYLFMSMSGLAFVYTLLYFFRPGQWVKWILLAFFTVNPIAPYVSNYISADALFIALSLLWLKQLIWILYRPRPYMVITQAVLLLIVFTVRYNAIYYPLIAGLAFMLSKQKFIIKLVGMGLGALLVAGSVFYTSHKMYKETGHRQFSAFGGWQLANNALYMYQNIPATQRKPVPKRFAKLETMVEQHFDTLSRVKMSKQDSASGFFYLWSDKGPLIQYMARQWKKDSTTPYFKRWAAEGPLYADYALYLIRNYPSAFANSFLLPNAVKFAVPPTEFLGIYNMGADSVGKLAKEWFNYKSLRVRTGNNKEAARMETTQVYPILSAIVNALLLICISGLIVFTGFKQHGKLLTKTIVLVLAFWLLNMAFSITAAPVVLRYQVFPMLISFSLSLLVVETIYKWGKEQDVNSENKMV